MCFCPFNPVPAINDNYPLILSSSDVLWQPLLIEQSDQSSQFGFHDKSDLDSGLENSTHPHVFTSHSGCRASENLDISLNLMKIKYFPIYSNSFCDAGQALILRYFLAWDFI